MAVKKHRQKSKAARVTAAKRAERAGESWEDQVARMDHPETADFRGRADDAPERVHVPVDPAVLRRRSWIGGIATLTFAIAAGVLMYLMARP